MQKRNVSVVFLLSCKRFNRSLSLALLVLPVLMCMRCFNVEAAFYVHDGSVNVKISDTSKDSLPESIQKVFSSSRHLSSPRLLVIHIVRSFIPIFDCSIMYSLIYRETTYLFSAFSRRTVHTQIEYCIKKMEREEKWKSRTWNEVWNCGFKVYTSLVRIFVSVLCPRAVDNFQVFEFDVTCFAHSSYLCFWVSTWILQLQPRNGNDVATLSMSLLLLLLSADADRKSVV